MTQLTTKELSALSEQLAAEQTVVAKYNRLAQETHDPALRTKFNEISQKHQTHYDTLFTFLR